VSGPGDIERRAARGGAITALAQTLRGASEAGASLFLARNLSPGDFGLVDMIVSVTGIIDLLKDFGLSSATIQREHLDPAQVNVLFWINLAIGAALTAVTALLAPLLALGYAKPELLQLTLALSLSTLVGSASVQQQALLKRELKFGQLAIADVGGSLLGSSCAVAAALAGWGVWALVVRQLVRLAAQTLITWVISPFRPSRPRRTNVRELLRFGTHVSGFQVMNYLERNLDNVLIGRFAGAEALGFYTKAYELMRLPISQINGPVSAVAVPALSRLGAEPERYRKVYLSVTRLLLLATVPLAPLTIFSAHWLVPAVLGQQWAASVPLFQCLAVGLSVKPLLNTTGWLFVSQARTQELWRWGVLGASLALLSFLIGLPWGALGVAVSYTAIDLLVRAPILIAWTGRSGPVSVRDLLGCLGPAWLFASATALCYALLDRQLTALPEGARVAICLPTAWAAGLACVAISPSGRAVLRDGARMLQLLRQKRAASEQAL
jgi:PST family polysaccharide transporter